MDYITLAAVLGYLAIPCAFFAFQSKSMRGMFFLNAAAAGFMGCHLLLIGATAGGIIALSGTLTLLVQMSLPDKSPFRLRLLIGVPSIILAIIFKEAGWFALLPVIAFAIGRCSEALYDPKFTRLGLATSFLIWLIYGALSGSLQAVIYEAIAIFSIILSFWNSRKKEAKPENNG